MAVKFTNNAATTLAAGINSSATSISVTDGSVFPSLSSGEHFYCTFDDTTNVEIVKVTARSSNTLTVVRGQDNTTARAFSSGDKAELRVVAALLEDVKTEVTSTLSVDTFTGDGSNAAFTLSQAPSSEDNLIVFIEGVYQNPGDFTLSGTTLTLDVAPANTRKVVAYHVSGAVSGNNLNHDQFTANGSTAAFTLSISPIHENNTQVFIDGVYQQKDSYAVSGTTLTLDANPANGAKVEVMTFTQTDVNTIPASFVAGLTEVAAVGSDHLLVYDATDGALKKALASDLIETVGATPTFSTANITNTTTGDSLLITTTEDSSTAAPVITLKRNSSSPADGDYLGQLKFKGENDADQEVIYAKVTGKISDASDTTEDGLLEFALRKAGSNNIGMRLTSTDLKLINGTGLEVAGNADVTGNLSAAKLTSNNGVLELDDNGSHNGIINVPASISINIDSDNGATTESFSIAKDKTGINDTDVLFRVMESGNVGIGTTSPASKFEVSNAGDPEVRLTNTSTSQYLRFDHNSIRTMSGQSLFLLANDKSNRKITIATDSNNDTRNLIGIGTSSPAAALHMACSGSHHNTNDAHFYLSKNSANDWSMYLAAGNDDYGFRTDGNGSYAIGVYNQPSSAWRARFNYNGELYLNGGSSALFNINSDERLKEEISNAPSQWELIKGLPLKRFKWIDRREGEKWSYGFIAQEVELTNPEFVQTVPQDKQDIDDGIDDPEYKTVAEGQIHERALAALQEAITRIEELEEKVRTLENA